MDSNTDLACHLTGPGVLASRRNSNQWRNFPGKPLATVLRRGLCDYKARRSSVQARLFGIDVVWIHFDLLRACSASANRHLRSEPQHVCPSVRRVRVIYGREATTS
ncbi:hypothetical protein D3C72_1568700 [compost metagenome]